MNEEPDFSRIPGADNMDIVTYTSMYRAIERNNMWEYIYNHEGTFRDNNLEYTHIIHETYREIAAEYYDADMVVALMALMRRLKREGWESFCNAISPSRARHTERSNAE